MRNLAVAHITTISARAQAEFHDLLIFLNFQKHLINGLKYQLKWFWLKEKRLKESETNKQKEDACYDNYCVDLFEGLHGYGRSSNAQGLPKYS